MRKKQCFSIPIFIMLLLIIPNNIYSYPIETSGTITKIFKEKRTGDKLFWMSELKTKSNIYILKLLPVGICSRPAFKEGDKIELKGYIPLKTKTITKHSIIIVNKLYIFTTEEEFILRNKKGKINWNPAEHKTYYMKAVDIEYIKGDYNNKIQWIHLKAKVKNSNILLNIRLCPSFTCYNVPFEKGDLLRIDGYYPPYPEGQKKPAFIACTINNLSKHKTIKIRDCKTRRPFWINK